MNVKPVMNYLILWYILAKYLCNTAVDLHTQVDEAAALDGKFWVKENDT